MALGVPNIRRVPITWGWRPWEGHRNIDTLVVHTMYNSAFSGDDRFSEAHLLAILKQYGVAPHYLILRDGVVLQLVDDNDIAFHAGESALPNATYRTKVNDFSLGIEMASAENTEPTDAQYESLAQLILRKLFEHPIRNILGHSQVALPPGRKTDPWNLDTARLCRILHKLGG